VDRRTQAGHADRPETAWVPLPAGLANPREQGASVFDGIAGLYNAVRPGYPAVAFDDLRARCGLSAASRVLEVGCGTGQATRNLARIGCAIQALEPGAALAALARRNLSDSANVRVSVSTFEDATEPSAAYDAIVSATAFHWTDARCSYTKAADLLVPGGSLALLTNAHGAGGNHTQEPMASAIRDLHRRLAPQIGSWTFPTREDLAARAGSGGDIAAMWSRLDRSFVDPPPVGELFEPPVVTTYPWLATYERAGYLDMLSSHSSYALLDPGRRAQLFDQIGRLIDEHLDGTITKEYVTILATARTRGSAAQSDPLPALD
jgi:SAM-dependent methyltransferase